MRKLSFTALAAIPLIFAIQTHAFEVRIDSPGGSMETAPRRDQSGFHFDLNNCYAQSSVQYWDAFRYSISKDQKNFKYSSPDFASVAASQSKLGGDGDYGSGFESDIIDYLNDYGNCSQQYIDLKKSLHKTIIHSVDALFELLSEFPTMSAVRDPVKVANHLSSMDSYYLRLRTDIQFANSEVIRKFDDTILLLTEQLKAVGRYYSSADLEFKIKHAASLDDFIADVLHFKCPEAQLLRAPPVKLKEIAAKSYQDIPNYLTQFHSTLLNHFKIGAKALPMMIGYCSEILTRSKWFYGQDSIFGMNGQDMCALHASIIIGIRYDETKVPLNIEVLVRNSYGTDCKSYIKDYECNKGDFWIPLWVLDRNLQTYLN